MLLALLSLTTGAALANQYPPVAIPGGVVRSKTLVKLHTSAGGSRKTPAVDSLAIFTTYGKIQL